MGDTLHVKPVNGNNQSLPWNNITTGGKDEIMAANPIYKIEDIQRNSTLVSNETSAMETVAENNWAYLICIVIVIAAITGNLLVVLAVRHERKLQTMFNYFLVSLAISDLTTAIAVMPIAILKDFLGYFPLPTQVCVVWYCLDVFLTSASIIHMCVISVDRYFSLRYPLKYGRTKRKRYVILKIFIVWVLSFFIAGPPFIVSYILQIDVSDYKGCGPETPLYIVFSSIASFYLPLFVMSFTYPMTIYALNKQRILVSSKQTKKMERLNKKQMKVSAASKFLVQNVAYMDVNRGSLKNKRNGAENLNSSFTDITGDAMGNIMDQSCPAIGSCPDLSITCENEATSTSSNTDNMTVSEDTTNIDSTITPQANEALGLPKRRLTKAFSCTDFARIASAKKMYADSWNDLSEKQEKASRSRNVSWLHRNFSQTGDKYNSDAYIQQTRTPGSKKRGTASFRRALFAHQMQTNGKIGGIHDIPAIHIESNSPCESFQHIQNASPKNLHQKPNSLSISEKSFDRNIMKSLKSLSLSDKQEISLSLTSLSSTDGLSDLYINDSMALSSSSLASSVHESDLQETPNHDWYEWKYGASPGEFFKSAALTVRKQIQCGNVFMDILQQQQEEQKNLKEIQRKNEAAAKRNKKHNHANTKPNSITYLKEVQKRKSIKLKKHMLKEKRASQVLGIMFGIFVLLYMPFFVTYVISGVCSKCRQQLTPLMVTTFEWLAWTASAVNPIIYQIFNPEFRNAFRKILKCQCNTLSNGFKKINFKPRSW
ncbi:unnamed protein product [Owenia fusiformis]|uniref:Uncharacterized protein n=1 Tax=Owenia fusiformis TaxID=6347 RepID=A0A8J1TGM3_OWEFU|nr:unnamed protein product [Owenia fusiformis]